ncbi:MAG: four helix bundle protein, partial [Clostridia bacterium]|nr:four helix bundle protein [Clostridia bacterium]
YWLQLLCRTGFITEKEYQSLADECLELKKILVASTNTLSVKVSGKKI